MTKPLTIWLLNPYGPLPSEGWRDYSYVLIGRALAQRGHQVIWWTSNFSHHFKTFRSEGWSDVTLEPGFNVRLVPTPGYRRNISPGRFARDLVFARRAYARAIELPPPDLIFTSESPLAMGYAGWALARRWSVPLVYDQMDLWPELIAQALPGPLVALGSLGFAPVYARRRRVFRDLDGAVALAEPYLRSIIRDRTGLPSIPELIVYNGIDVARFRRDMERPLPEALAAALARPGPKAIFAGTLGPSYDVGPMIAAAQSGGVTVYIAGDGPERHRVEAAAANNPALVYLGKLAPDVLPAVYARCDIGMAAYSPRSNVEMPDKFYDYTAAGLAVVNSLTGEVADWIAREQVGLAYRGGDGASLAAVLAALTADAERLAATRARSWTLGGTFDQARQHAPLEPFLRDVIEQRRARHAA